jgi:hypothetical protein
MARFWSTLCIASLAAATVWSSGSRADNTPAQPLQYASPSEAFSGEMQVLQKAVSNHGRVWFRFRGWSADSQDNVEPRKECTIQTHYLIHAQGPVQPMPIQSICQVPVGKLKPSSIKVLPFCRDRHCLAPNQAAMVELESSVTFPCTVNEGDNCSTWKDATKTTIRFNSRFAAARAAKALRAMATACGAPEDEAPAARGKKKG